MEEMMWNDEDIPGAGALSYDEGLQEIEAWYANREGARGDIEQQHDGELPFTTEMTAGDEFETLMGDIEQLTQAPGPTAHIATTAASNVDEHVVASADDLSPGMNTDLPEADITTQSMEAIPHSSRVEVEGDIDSISQSALPEAEKAWPTTLSPKHEHMPEPPPTADLEMTTPKGEETLHPPSSGTKSSLLEEMRTEEDAQKQKRHLKRVEIPKLALPELTSDTHSATRELPDSAVEVGDARSGLEASSGGASLPNRSLKVPQKRVSKRLSVVHDEFPKQTAGNRTTGAVRRSTRLKEAHADKASCVEPATDSADEVRTKEQSLPKRKTGDADEHLGTDGEAGTAVKKTKTASELPHDPIVAAKPGFKAVAHQWAPKNAVGRNEIRLLTQSPILAGDVLPQRKSGARQTRAQREEEAKRAPNAGRAAKERHRNKDVGQD